MPDASDTQVMMRTMQWCHLGLPSTISTAAVTAAAALSPNPLDTFLRNCLVDGEAANLL